MRNPSIPGYLKPLGYQQITNLSAAVGLTVPAQTRYILIQAESQNVRWRDDGTNPTAAIGMIIASGTTLEYTGDGTAIKFFEAAASAKLNVSYFG
jgi:hypothetical protein